MYLIQYEYKYVMEMLLCVVYEAFYNLKVILSHNLWFEQIN